MKKTNFFKELKNEYQQVIWPKGTEVKTKTLLVLGISVALTLLIFALDSVYSFGINEFIKGIM